MQIISDRRKNVSMEIRGKCGRNPSCVLALVTRTCKRLESRKGIAEKNGETRHATKGCGRPAPVPGRVSPRMWAILWSSILLRWIVGSLRPVTAGDSRGVCAYGGAMPLHTAEHRSDRLIKAQ